MARRAPSWKQTARVLLVVDAANVVGSRPDGWWRDRSAAAARLVARLARVPGTPVGGDVVARVAVVLEGQARAGAPVGGPAQVQVVHADAGGDDALVALCGPGVLLVTADRELRARGQAAGARTTSPRTLLDALDALDSSSGQAGPADGPVPGADEARRGLSR